MIGTIVSAVIAGAIIGGLARLFLKGKQNIGLIMTILLGALGALAGSWIAHQFGYSKTEGIKWIPFFIGIGAAMVFISVYLAITGRKNAPRR